MNRKPETNANKPPATRRRGRMSAAQAQRRAARIHHPPARGGRLADRDPARRARAVRHRSSAIQAIEYYDPTRVPDTQETVGSAVPRRPQGADRRPGRADRPRRARSSGWRGASSRSSRAAFSTASTPRDCAKVADHGRGPPARAQGLRREAGGHQSGRSRGDQARAVGRAPRPRRRPARAPRGSSPCEARHAGVRGASPGTRAAAGRVRQGARGATRRSSTRRSRREIAALWTPDPGNRPQVEAYEFEGRPPALWRRGGRRQDRPADRPRADGAPALGDLPPRLCRPRRDGAAADRDPRQPRGLQRRRHGAAAAGLPDRVRRAGTAGLRIQVAGPVARLHRLRRGGAARRAQGALRDGLAAQRRPGPALPRGDRLQPADRRRRANGC